MIIYLYGPDSYQRGQKLKELIEAYRKKYNQVDMLGVDLEENPDLWLKAKDFLRQPSLFLENKVLVVKESNIPEEKEWIQALKAELQNPKTFILISDTGSPKKVFKFLVEEPTKHQFFGELKGATLTPFLEKEVRRRGLRFEPSAWRYFQTYIDSSEEKSWLAVAELDKLRLLVSEKPITINDLKQITPPSLKENSFPFQNLISSNIAKRLAALENLFLDKEPPVYIFNALAFRASGQRAVDLAQYDVAIKSGRLGYEEALTVFAIS
jgi:DNA polymerase III delta subunit